MENKHTSSETSDKKYQELLEVENAVIFQLSAEGEFTSLNSEWTNMTNYTPSESLGTSFFNMVSADGQSVLQEQFHSLREGHKDGIHHEIKLVTKQGREEEVHLFLRADVDSGQNIVSFSGTLTDLSSRKEGIDAYKKNESNYRLISEHMTDMVAVLAADGLVLYASPSHAAVLGRNLDEYIGSYPIKSIHPDDWERVFHFFHKMVSNWTTLDIEYRCMHDNGTFLDLEMKGTPIKSPDGEIQVITVSRDITLRKRAEEELRQTTMKLKTLVSSLPYGVMVEDEEGRMVLHNDAYSNIFHYHPKASMPSEKDQPLLANEMECVIKDFPAYQRKKGQIVQSRQSRQSEEIRLTDGQIVECDAIPMLEEGHFDGYLWIFRDVTEKKVAERKLQEANQILQKLSMIDGLTGIANRRCFNEALEKKWNKVNGSTQPISLLLLDIDFFKAFNDLYGHQAGDACLQQVGSILESISWGSQDLAARYGGEEFVVLLPGKTAEQAIETASAIQKAIEQAHIPHHGSSIGEYLTLSIGISTIMAAGMGQPAHLIAEADKALYEAKRNGRNQIRVYNQG